VTDMATMAPTQPRPEGTRPAPAPPPAVTASGPSRQVVAAVLDDLQITDRIYYHLYQTNPLVAELLDALRSTHRPPARMLVIGGNLVLNEALCRLGYRVDLWQLREGYCPEEVEPLVRARISVAELAALAPPLPIGVYDAIIAPHILEGLPGNAAAWLAALRQGLAPGGSLLLATANLARLNRRLHVLAGRSPAELAPKTTVSFSWAALPQQRLYHRDELLELATRAGYQVRACRFVNGERVFSDIEPMGVVAFAGRQAGRWLTERWPSTRGTILLHLAPRVGDEATDAAPRGVDELTVSVVVAARHGGEALRALLATLLTQDFPPERYEILVLAAPSADAVRAIVAEMSAESRVQVRVIETGAPEGPAARNQAMRLATGDICAHTDDACRPSPDWIRSTVAGFDASTGIVTGPVLDTNGSYPHFMTLPGCRPWGEYQGLHPIYNTASRRRPAPAAGGFADMPLSHGDTPLGWDSDLAWRLQRQGWGARFHKLSTVLREHAWPEGLSWLRDEWARAVDFPAAVERVPEWRRQLLAGGIFADRGTMLFDLLALGGALAVLRRQWWWLLLGLPWFSAKSTYLDFWPPSEWRRTAITFGRLVARHIVWLIGLLIGSWRARRPTL